MKKIGMVAVMAASGLFAGESVDWRGPGRTGTYDETGLLKSWPEGGPTLLWTATGVGEGYASLCVTAERIYTTGLGEGEQSGSEFVVALDKEGKIL